NNQTKIAPSRKECLTSSRTSFPSAKKNATLASPIKTGYSERTNARTTDKCDAAAEVFICASLYNLTCPAQCQAKFDLRNSNRTFGTDRWTLALHEKRYRTKCGRGSRRNPDHPRWWRAPGLERDSL